MEQDNGLVLFVEPYERLEPFTKFLDYIQKDSNSSPSDKNKMNVKYAQTRE